MKKPTTMKAWCQKMERTKQESVKYQVFVSSTFEDLIEERKAVSQAILEADCIPAGMELFPASTESQWTFIKKVIDESDVYLVLSGGRYGSLAKNTDNKNKVSYTEMEYDYARQQGKPILAFIHEDPGTLPAKKCEDTKIGTVRLNRFRKELSNARLRKTWINKDDLKSAVQSALREICNHPTDQMIGWVKANSLVSSNNAVGIILDAPKVVKLESEVKSGNQIYIICSRFKLDSEDMLIGTISDNIRKGCKYTYIFSENDAFWFKKANSKWWKQFKEDLLSQKTSLDDRFPDAEEYMDIINEYVPSSPKSCEDTLGKAKEYYINHIDAFQFDSAFVPTTIAIYEKESDSEDISLNGIVSYDILIPLPTSSGYYAYLVPKQQVFAFKETVERVLKLCIKEKQLHIDVSMLK